MSAAMGQTASVPLWAMQRENRTLPVAGIPTLVGKSVAFARVMSLVARIAGCNAPVLIEGETGTGKELVTRAIHYGGHRHDKPFLPVNCGAIPEALFESQLFGHQKGAFTDAKEDQRGLIHLADGGSLFLDEVEALAPKSQVALLRFLQDQRYRPLGARTEQAADVRIIAASNIELQMLINERAFRSDLFYRLNVLNTSSYRHCVNVTGMYVFC
jgi:two-component system, NtrC family, response regulator GlrR